jgi:hypothetical protein
MLKNLILASFAFAVPICYATYSNWQDVRPYVVGDPETAEGRLLYFAGRG